jgi:hypothetical protein
MIYSNKDELKNFPQAQLKTGKSSRTEYYEYNPEKIKLHRIQIQLLHISGSL